jgi:hypothetical protein
MTSLELSASMALVTEIDRRLAVADRLIDEPGHVADAERLLDEVDELLAQAVADASLSATARRLACARSDLGSLLLAATAFEIAEVPSDGLLRRAVAAVRAALD